MSEKKEYNWIPVIELAVLAFTTLGTTIVLFTHADNNARDAERRTDRLLEGMRQDILGYHKETCELLRDFHGRLCAIEERKK